MVVKDVFIKDLAPGKEAYLLCWVANKRRVKNNLFLDVYDSTGIMQCVAENGICKDFDDLANTPNESAIQLFGKMNIADDFEVLSFQPIAIASISLTPTPNYLSFDPFDSRFAAQIIKHPTFYIRNKKLNACYYFKSVFKRELQKYFWDKQFIEFESPTLTRQTLYDEDGALWLETDGNRISLSRCATFHLEPALFAYERVFTLANSHAYEGGTSKRHLAEFTHLKAELCWCNLDDLVSLASDMYYEVAKSTLGICYDIIKDIIDEKTVEKKLKQLQTIGSTTITYNEAVDILKGKGINFEYGKSLSTQHERLLTEHFDECFVWVKYIPYTVEGFMFKRLENDQYLTKTCDLIAPEGFGEILGCAEKITDYQELVDSMIQKNKWQDREKYSDYLLLHKYGLPPHGGIGMGVERAVRFVLNLDDVKYTKPFAVKKLSSINH